MEGETATRTEALAYEAGTGDLSLRIEEPFGTPDLRRETWFYRESPEQGQVTTVEEATNAGIRITDLAYDPESIHVIRVNDGANNDHFAFTHPALNALSMTVDPNGFTAIYTLDGFGRPRVVEQDDGYVETIKYGEVVVGAMTTTRTSVTGEYTAESIDALGRVINRRWRSFDGEIIETRTVHDPSGREQHQTLPAPETGFDGPTVSTRFDGAGRTIELVRADGSSKTWAYPSLARVIEVDEVGDERWIDLDVAGRVGLLKEHLPPGSPVVTAYHYGAFGDLRSVSEPAHGSPSSVVTTVMTDVRGRVRQVADPNAGTFTFSYDGFGNLIEEAAGPRQVTYQHDQLGRVTDIEMVDALDHRRIGYDYDACVNGRGRLCSAQVVDYLTDATVIKTLGYDSLGREVAAELRIEPGLSDFTAGLFKTERAYDPFGRLSQITYPEADGLGNRFALEYKYQNGFLATARWPAKDVTFWEALSYTPDGRLDDSRVGDLVENRSFSATRRWLTSLTISKGATTLESIAYAFFPDGNVEKRIQGSWSGDTYLTIDSFTHDALDRLKTWKASGHRDADVTYAYEPSGNITLVTESSLGGITGLSEQYEYFSSARQRVRRFRPRGGSFSPVFAYDALGRLTSGYFGDGGETKVDYTAHDLPRRVAKSATHTETEFAYDPFGARVIKLEDGSETTYVDDLYERRGKTHVFHVFAGDQRVAQVVFDGEDLKYQYFTQDGLDTVNTTWTEDVPERQFFSPFGERMDLDGAPRDGSPVEDVTRGFTGHEHDDALGLINMKGRVYVPRLRRFATPDPLSPPVLRIPSVCLTGDCEDEGDAERIGKNRAAGAVQAPSQLGSTMSDSTVGARRTVAPLSTDGGASGGGLHATPSGGADLPSRAAHAAEVVGGHRGAIETASGQRHHRYSYVSNAPLRMKDPSGLNPVAGLAIAEAVMDGFFVGWDIADAREAAASGDTATAVIMAGATVVDIYLLTQPGAPAVGGTTARAGKGLVEEGAQAVARVLRKADTATEHGMGKALKYFEGKVGDMPKPPRGSGSVPKEQRDPKRFWTKEERAAKRTEQGDKCATGCGADLDEGNSRGHHVVRHADGGRTVDSNHAEVCVDCHEKIHAPDDK